MKENKNNTTFREKTGVISLTEEQYQSLIDAGYDVKDITIETRLSNIENKLDEIVKWVRYYGKQR